MLLFVFLIIGKKTFLAALVKEPKAENLLLRCVKLCFSVIYVINFLFFSFMNHCPNVRLSRFFLLCIFKMEVSNMSFVSIGSYPLIKWNWSIMKVLLNVMLYVSYIWYRIWCPCFNVELYACGHWAAWEGKGITIQRAWVRIKICLPAIFSSTTHFIFPSTKGKYFSFWCGPLPL